VAVAIAKRDMQFCIFAFFRNRVFAAFSEPLNEINIFIYLIWTAQSMSAFS
jgi:hypothetical protein